MKKVLSLLLFLPFLTSALAGNTITVKSGETSVFSFSEEATITFDYSKAEIEGKGVSLEDYFDEKGYKKAAQWERAKEFSHKEFIKRYNKKSPGLKLVEESKSAKYNVDIQIRAINFGNTLKSLLPVGLHTDGGAVLYGRIIVKDKNGTELCILKFSNVKGLGSTGIEARMMFVYQQLSSDLLKFLKKSKSSQSLDEDDDE